MNSVGSKTTETYQNLILQREPHYVQERLALANGKNVGTIDPLPVLNGTGIGATSMCELLAGRRCNNRSRRIVGCGSTDPQSAGGVGAETSQETLDSTNGLEGLEVVGVDE